MKRFLLPAFGAVLLLLSSAQESYAFGFPGSCGTFCTMNKQAEAENPFSITNLFNSDGSFKSGLGAAGTYTFDFGSIFGGGGGGGSFGGGGPAGVSGAYGGGTIGTLLCNVVGWFTGSLGQGIATLSVLVLGVGALFGKVSHGMALVTLVGISVIFGAPDIVQDLTGQVACY